VNGVALTNANGSLQPYGALKATTDPNGATVSYAYDGLGRLRKVAQPGDTLADPSEEWRYYDGIETAWTTTATGFSTGPYLSDHLVRGISGGGWTSATLATFDRTIYDGLGRAIQTQTPAGQGWAWSSCSAPQPLGSEVIQSTLYDALGRAAIQTVPYTQTQYQYCTTAGRVNTPYVAVPQTTTVSGSGGLLGSYYSGMNFNTLAFSRTDSTVDFSWGDSPGGSVPGD
jgi:YD repeat-containing protein